MAKREVSSGGIIFKKNKNGFEVLLIKDSYGHWSWPKGKIDKGETPEQAALREIKEEVGLSGISLLGKAGESKYFYKFKGELISKTVFFFLCELVDDEELKIQKEEVDSAEWFTPETALNTVYYKGARKLLEKAVKMYKDKWLRVC